MASLLTLSVENFVLIERAEIELAAGLTIVSGQTGAGKSLLLRALDFLLGGRLQVSDVLTRENAKARVEGIFALSDDRLKPVFQELGLGDAWSEEELSIARSMDASGRSRAQINGRATTLANLRELTSRLVSVLSQHEYQRLVRPELQTQVLDAFGGFQQSRIDFDARRRELSIRLNELHDMQRRHRDGQSQLTRARDELALLEKLDPKDGEAEALLAEVEVLRRAEEMTRTIGSTVGLLSEQDDSIQSQLRRSQRRLEDLTDLLPPVGEAIDALESASEAINDAVAALQKAERGIDDDPRRLQRIEDRLTALREISRKLRIPVEKLAEERARLRDLAVDDLAPKIEALELSLKKGLKDLAASDEDLAKRRAEAAPRLAAAVEASLVDLGMDRARFSVVLDSLPPKAARLDLARALPPAGGHAQAQFLLAANPGEEARPVADVASGGELSRIMLALQRHLGKVLEVAMLVFDEVDQNVGGRLGLVIGRELSALSRERQVLVISHLPQVAAFADRHWLAEKRIEGAETRTRFRVLDGEERVRELAAMTRGAEISDTALAEAREILVLAGRAQS